MSVSNQNHNVSVRLNDSDFKQLQYLQDKYIKRSYGRVSLADVLRIAVKDLYVKEIAMEKEDNKKEKAVTIVLEEDKKETTKE